MESGLHALSQALTSRKHYRETPVSGLSAFLPATQVPDSFHIAPKNELTQECSQPRVQEHMFKMFRLTSGTTVRMCGECGRVDSQCKPSCSPCWDLTPYNHNFTVYEYGCGDNQFHQVIACSAWL